MRSEKSQPSIDRKRVTRRTVLASGVAVGAGVLPLKLLGQGTTKKSKMKAEIEEQKAQVLALTQATLPADAMKALGEQIAGVDGDTISRNKHPLVENSEPYILFEAMPREVKVWE